MSVGVLPAQGACLEKNRLPANVVNKPEPAHPDPVLPIPRANTLQLLDGMPAGPVVGICTEDREDCLVLVTDLRMCPRQLLQRALEVCGRLNIKLVHRFAERLGLAALLARSSASRSPAGRVRPAAMSALLFSICARIAGSRASR